jgi:hypothetical protein
LEDIYRLQLNQPTSGPSTADAGASACAAGSTGTAVTSGTAVTPGTT